MLPCQQLAYFHAHFVNALAVDHRIGTRKVDVFVNAERLLFLAAVSSVGMDAVVVNHDDLARLHIAQEFRADAVKHAGFAGDNPAVVPDLSQRQRTHSPWVTHGDQLIAAHDRHGIGSLYLLHGLGDSLFDGTGLHTLACDQIRHRLRVTSRLEHGAVVL